MAERHTYGLTVVLGVAISVVASLVSTAVTGLATSAESETLASRFVAIDAIRLLDTRRGGEPVTADGEISIPVVGVGTVPTSGVTAVALTVTTTNAQSPGFVTAWPTGAPRPNVSNLNVQQAGDTVSNLVFVPVGNTGAISLYTSMTADVIVDLAGWFTAAPHGSRAGRFIPIEAHRASDTRRSSSGQGAAGELVAADAVVDVPIGTVPGIPQSGITAVLINVTTTDTSDAGFVRVWPTGDRQPATSNLNATRSGDTVAGLAVVPVGVGVSVSVYTQMASHLIVDVLGWFTDDTAPLSTSGLLVAVDPQRLIDTRTGGSPLPAQTRHGIGVATAPPGATAVANLTVTATSGPLYLTAGALEQVLQSTSNLNASSRGATRANVALLPVASGHMYVWSSASTHLIADLQGWFTP